MRIREPEQKREITYQGVAGCAGCGAAVYEVHEFYFVTSES